MSDTIDLAQANEQRHRDIALHQARTHLRPKPGGVLCMDCDSEIAPARRLANPHAERCIVCQQEFESSGR